MPRCLCDCHSAPDALWRADGVDARDALEAAVACDACRHRHCEALLVPLHETSAPPEPPRDAYEDSYGDEDGG